MEDQDNANSSFSFKQEPFKLTQNDTNPEKKSQTSKTVNITMNNNYEYFNNQGDSPKFNISKDQLLNDISNIPQTELDFKSTIEHEVSRKKSQDLNYKSISPRQKQHVDQKDEVEHAKKSHLEYLRIIRDNKDPLGVKSKGLQEISASELAKHNKPNDLWMAIQGKVFDLTMYLDYHPGGEKMLMKGAGKDATDLFNYHHPWVNYMNLVGKLQIGFLK